jgi:hypothetical protein
MICADLDATERTVCLVTGNDGTNLIAPLVSSVPKQRPILIAPAITDVPAEVETTPPMIWQSLCFVRIAPR